MGTLGRAEKCRSVVYGWRGASVGRPGRAGPGRGSGHPVSVSLFSPHYCLRHGRVVGKVAKLHCIWTLDQPASRLTNCSSSVVFVCDVQVRHRRPLLAYRRTDGRTDSWDGIRRALEATGRGDGRRAKRGEATSESGAAGSGHWTMVWSS